MELPVWNCETWWCSVFPETAPWPLSNLWADAPWAPFPVPAAADLLALDVSCHWTRTTCSLCIWFLPPGVIFSEVHPCSRMSLYFIPFRGWIRFPGWLGRILCIPLLVQGCWVILIWGFCGACFQSSRVNTPSRVAGSCGNFYLTFWGIAKLLSMVAAPFCIFTPVFGGPSFFTPSPTLWLSDRSCLCGSVGLAHWDLNVFPVAEVTVETKVTQQRNHLTGLLQRSH